MYADIKREGEAPTKEPWQDVLERAACLLQTEGWIQRQLKGVHGRCVMGAIAAASGDQMLSFFTTEAAVRLATHLDVFSLAAWNDAPWRTRAEVVAALNEAARGESRCS